MLVRQHVCMCQLRTFENLQGWAKVIGLVARRENNVTVRSFVGRRVWVHVEEAECMADGASRKCNCRLDYTETCLGACAGRRSLLAGDDEESVTACWSVRWHV